MRKAFRLLVLSILFIVGCMPAGNQAPGGPSLDPDATIPTASTPVPAPLSAVAVNKPQLISFEMLNELDGWGVTESALLRTNNGGTSWHNVTPPEMSVLGYGAARSFLDNKRAFILIPDASDPLHRGTLFRTQDGGETWTSNQVPFGSCQMRFFDTERGWAMAGLGVAAGSNAIAIFQTGDGGENWEQVFTNDPMADGSSDEIPLGGLKGAFFPLDMQTAWVGGVIYSPATVYLFRTDDGGRHWKPAELQLPLDSEQAQLSIESIQFVTAMDGWLSMQVTQNTTVRVLYVTRNGGDTWKLLPAVFANVRAVDFVSQQDGFIFDGERFHVTHDGGETWAQVQPDLVFGESFSGMDFVNSRTGWVTVLDPTSSQIRLYKTTDSGATWIPQ